MQSEVAMGAGVPEKLPKELDRWNWGAFGLTWIWGISNRTPAAWFVFVPLLGWFVMPIVLGLKGSQWAWRNRQWADVAAFQRSQRSWARGAGLAWAIGLVSAAGLGFGLVQSMRSSEAYQLASAELKADPAMAEAFGSPLELGWPRGSIKLSGGSGEAQLDFSVSGPKAQGRAYVSATKQVGEWKVQSAQVKLDNGVVFERE
jgi:hypothetical protein